MRRFPLLREGKIIDEKIEIARLGFPSPVGGGTENLKGSDAVLSAKFFELQRDCVR